MSRREPNVIPFRPRPRKWTRPEDFGHDPRQAPRPPKPPKRPDDDRRRLVRKLAGWALIAAVVGATVAYSVWG